MRVGDVYHAREILGVACFGPEGPRVEDPEEDAGLGHVCFYYAVLSVAHNIFIRNNEASYEAG